MDTLKIGSYGIIIPISILPDNINKREYFYLDFLVLFFLGFPLYHLIYPIELEKALVLFLLQKY